MYDRAIQINPNFYEAYTNKGEDFNIFFRNCPIIITEI